MHEDTYSWLMLTLVKTWQGEEEARDESSDMGDVTHIGLVHAIAAWAFSVGLEAMVVVFFLTANKELGAKVTNGYMQEHYNMDLGRAAEALRQAAASGQRYEPPALLEACVQQNADHAHTMFWIYYVTLTFWLMTMVTEIKEAVWLAIHIMGIHTKHPLTVTGEHNPKKLFHEDVAIVRLETWMKGVLVMLIPFFKLGVALVLTYVGCSYLILSTNVTDMVIKTVALQFVIRMDDVAAESLLTMGDIDELRSVKLHTAWGRPSRRSLWDRGLGGMFFIFIIAMSLLIMTTFIYGDVFSFRYACGEYHARFPS